MIFFDTNVLIYFSINQDDKKQILSQNLIEEAIRKNKLFISPLVMIEYIFTLSKLKMLDLSSKRVEFFKKFVQKSISLESVFEAYKLCKEIGYCKNINDTIHLKVAEKYCQKLVTFDSDFKKFQQYTNLSIDILRIE